MAGDEKLRLFCALRLADETLDRLVDWQGGLHGGPGGSPRRTFTPRSRSSARRPPGASRASWMRCARRRGGSGELRFTLRGYRETRSVGMLTLRRRGQARGRAGRPALRRRSRTIGVYEREARPWLPHVTVLRFRERPRLAPGAARARRGRAVRCCCFPFPSCARGARSTTYSKLCRWAWLEGG